MSRAIRASASRTISIIAVFALLLGACAPAATAPAASAAPPAATAGSSEWDLVVAAAKKEGSINVVGPNPIETYRAALEKFTAAYPEIKITIVGGGSAVFLPKMEAERQSGQFNWDVWINNCALTYRRLTPNGQSDPIKPLFRTETANDKDWLGGFAAGWLDNEKQNCYAFEGDQKPAILVNRDVVPESQLSTLDQLLDPKWSGKIAMQDPRVLNAGSGDLGALLASKGKDYAGKLLAQKPTLVGTEGSRQLAEWLVRGTYPIVLGLTAADLAPFEAQGLGKNVKGLEVQPGGKGAYTLSNWGGVSLINKAPHPNAAKVYVNWLLSKDAQTLWVQACGGCASRRTDVKPGPGAAPADPASVFLDQQTAAAFKDQAVAFAKEAIK